MCSDHRDTQVPRVFLRTEFGWLNWNLGSKQRGGDVRSRSEAERDLGVGRVHWLLFVSTVLA